MKKSVPCPHCKLVYTELSLYQHNRIMHRDKRFSCKHCSNCYAKKEELKEHHVYIHPEITTFKCPVCPKDFSTQIFLFKHQSSEHKMKPFECTQCTAKFSRNWTLKKHTIVLHLGQEYLKDKYASCTECNKMLFNKWELRRHMKQNHPSKNTLHCRTCYITFQTNEDHNQHINLIHSIDQYQCKVCKKDFYSKYNFNQHTLSTHPIPDQLTCDIGPQSINSNDNLKDPYSNVHLVSKFKCAQCQKEFSYKHGLKRHELSVHSKTQSKVMSVNSSRLENYPDKDVLLFSKIKDESDDESMLKHDNGSDTKQSKSSIERVACEQCN